jgi:cysteine-rich repeat protein
VRRIEQGYAGDAFAAIYGQSPDELVEPLARQTGCLGGAAYVQDAVVRPVAVCGNRVKETGEQCDDGNVMAGDGCSPTCTIEAPASPAAVDKAG